MQACHAAQSPYQTEGMGEVPRQGERCLAALQSLLRIAQIPEGMRPLSEASHARILLGQSDLRAVLVGIIDRPGTVQFLQGPGQFAEIQQSLPEHKMSP